MHVVSMMYIKCICMQVAYSIRNIKKKESDYDIMIYHSNLRNHSESKPTLPTLPTLLTLITLVSFWGNRIILGFFVFSLSTTCFLLSVGAVHSQDLSLSVSPPITEVLIKPGKEISQRYIVTNNGEDTVLKVYIQPFSPTGTKGDVALGRKVPGVDLPLALSCFTIEKPKLLLGESFALLKGMSQEIVLKISIKEEIPQGDYYFTLIFETEEKTKLGGPGGSAKAMIGSNILLTISQNGEPMKLAKISKFEVPKFIDSFSDLNIDIQVANAGEAKFKTIGEVSIKPLIGKEKTIKIAPQNILISSKRDILCLDGEQIIPCGTNSKFLLGIYKTSLSFRTDSEPKTYREEKTTVVLPFTLLIGLSVTYVFYKSVKTKTSKPKKRHDKNA